MEYIAPITQGICNEAGTMIPTPIGMAVLFLKNNKSRNIRKMITVNVRDILRNSSVSFADSFRARDSIGLFTQRLITDNETHIRKGMKAIPDKSSLTIPRARAISAVEQIIQILADLK